MADDFISYSRRDREFTRVLYKELIARKREIWVDWEEIPPTTNWLNEIRAGIESSDNFIMIISPDWCVSGPCRAELEYALSCNKRLVPILYRPIA